MNALSSLRKNIEDALKVGGINAYSYVDTKISTPAAVVATTNPYLTYQEGTTFGNYLVALNVYLLTGMGKESDDKTDELIIQAITALGEFDVTEVSDVQRIEVGNVSYMGVVLAIEASITI